MNRARYTKKARRAGASDRLQAVYKRSLAILSIWIHCTFARSMKMQLSRWLKNVGEMVNRSPGLVIVFYTLIYFSLTLPTAARKPFWYDEIFTWVIATRGSFAEVLRVLQQGWDPQPPLYHLLVRVGRAVVDSELGLRLPSVAGL